MHEGTIEQEKPERLFAKLGLSGVISVATAYSVAVGLAYLWGYWSPFNVNILEYMGFADIFTAAAWPLMGTFVSMMGGMLVAGPSNKQEGVASKSRIGSALIWYWANLQQLHFALILLVFTLDTTVKWWLLGLMCGVPLSVYLMQHNWVAQVPLPRDFLMVIVFFVVAAPFAAIHTGLRNSESLRDGQTYLAVYSDVEGFPIAANTKAESRLRLIGLRGETLFMWDPLLKRVVISKFQKGQPLVVGRVEKTASPPPWDFIVEKVKNVLN